METKIERFIDDVGEYSAGGAQQYSGRRADGDASRFDDRVSRNPNSVSIAGLRKINLRAHRQAWAWQDEWLGLTIEDVRRIEAETQAELARTMAENGEAGDLAATQQASPNAVDLHVIDADSSEPLDLQGVQRGQRPAHRPGQNRRSSRHAIQSSVEQVAWRMEGIVCDSDSESEEFFDAEDVDEPGLPNVAPELRSSLTKWSSVEMVHHQGIGDGKRRRYGFRVTHL